MYFDNCCGEILSSTEYHLNFLPLCSFDVAMYQVCINLEREASDSNKRLSTRNKKYMSERSEMGSAGW